MRPLPLPVARALLRFLVQILARVHVVHAKPDRVRTTCRHLEMENPSEALPLIKESLDGRRQTLGDDHINTLNSISLLSEVYADLRVRPKPRQNTDCFSLCALVCSRASTWMYSDTGCCCLRAGVRLGAAAGGRGAGGPPLHPRQRARRHAGQQ